MENRGSNDPEDPERASPTAKRCPPEDVFGMLANDTRVSILRELGDPPGRSMTFSTLFEASEIDDSGNFSYHLNELMGTFVHEKSDGYQLTQAGEQVFGAIQSGTYNAEATVPPTPIGETCQLCSSHLVFKYIDESVHVYCSGCENGRIFPFPPGLISDYDVEELPAVSARWYRTQVQRITDGFCLVCAGPVEGELVEAVRSDETSPQPSMVAFECKKCGKRSRLSTATIATFHPVIEGFLFEHGFDTRTGPHSAVWEALDRTAETVTSQDSPTVEVTFEHADELVTAVVNSEATVVSVERH